MANEKRLIDANVVRHKIDAFASTVVYRGSALMITGKDSCNPYEYTRGYEQGVLDAVNIVMGQPTVDAVEVVHGRWILTAHEEYANCRWKVTAECSECNHDKGEIYAGFFTGFPKDMARDVVLDNAKSVKLDNFCPNCGASMKDKEN